MRLTLFSIIFCLIAKDFSLKVFEFKNTKNSLELASATSKIYLIDNPTTEIIICSNHKQTQLNTENTQTIYVIYNDDSFQKPWFSIGFWNKVMLWANINGQSWFKLGNMPFSIILDWIHICVRIDFDSKTLTASINGQIFPVVYNITHLPLNPKFNIRLGIVHHSDLPHKQQFYGSITNFVVYENAEKIDLEKISQTSCSNEYNPNIKMDDLSWDLIGDVKENYIDKDLLCSKNNFVNLRLPLIWNKITAVESCSKLGHGKLTEFEDPSNISSLNFENIYGEKYQECKFFWTPYSDSKEENVFINENTNQIIEYALRISI